MSYFVCAHCQSVLGEQVEEASEPTCQYHPNGIVTLVVE